MLKAKVLVIESDDAVGTINAIGELFNRFAGNVAGEVAPQIATVPAAVALPSPDESVSAPRRPRQTSAVVAKPPKRKPGQRGPQRTGTSAERYRNEAEKILRKAGKPMLKADVARKVGIPPGSATGIWK